MLKIPAGMCLSCTRGCVFLAVVWLRQRERGREQQAEKEQQREKERPGSFDIVLRSRKTSTSCFRRSVSNFIFSVSFPARFLHLFSSSLRPMIDKNWGMRWGSSVLHSTHMQSFVFFSPRTAPFFHTRSLPRWFVPSLIP